jgi:hypothetical protein
LQRIMIIQLKIRMIKKRENYLILKNFIINIKNFSKNCISYK